jgi:hypothetical protein
MNVHYSTGNHLIRQEKVYFAPLLIHVGSGIRDLGSEITKNVRIRDKHPGSATLLKG